MFYILDGREHFYQWDIDRKIVVEDQTIEEVHFCNGTGDCAFVVEVKEEDGKRVAAVPNVLLQKPFRVKVYGYTSNYTKYYEVFKVEPRNMPDDYVYTETEIKRYGDLEERIEALEAGGGGGGSVSPELEQQVAENTSRIEVLENKPSVNPELEQQVAANTERIEVLENKPDAACECKRLNITLAYNNVGSLIPEFSIEPLELLKMTQEEVDELDILVIGDYTNRIVNKCKVGNDKIEFTFTYINVNGDNSGALEEERLDIYKDETREEGYFTTFYSNARYYLYHLPNPQNGGGRQYLVAENNVYKLVDDVGTGGGESGSEEEEPKVQIMLYESNGSFTYEDEEFSIITPAYLFEAFELNVMNIVEYAVINTDAMTASIYKINSIDMANMTLDMSNGIKVIHMAADGSLSYVPLFTDGEGVSY